MNPPGNPHAENGPRPVEGWPSDDRAPAGAEQCAVESDARRNAVSYYNETYHSEHFGGLLRDERYYNLLAQFWRYSLFDRTGLDAQGKVLDYGSGIGQVSAALPDSVCFDISRFAVTELRKRGRIAVDNPKDIPSRAFDYLLSSHSLEHSSTPYEDLKQFRTYIQPAGRFVLVLPVELNLRYTLQSDWNEHLFAWTFQTITNLLRATGWTPLLQSTIYPPFMLRTLGRLIHSEWTVPAAYFIGRLRRQVPYMLTIAKLSE
jgi:SAM-dependent methyltransferase